jgi:translocation and assembly module TamB
MSERSTHTMLPPVARRKKRRDFGRHFARLVCVLFAIVGFIPVGGALVLRSTWARQIASRETTRIVRDQGFEASYEVGIRLWPLSVVLTHVRVESKDGGAPVLEADRIVAKPKIFALLAGKLVIDQVEAERPRVRVVYADRKIVNLGIEIPESKDDKDEPWKVPFDVVSLSDASFDVDVEGVHAVVEGVDLDVTADDERGLGASFEIAVHVGKGRVRMLRTFEPTPKKPVNMASYEDVLCNATGRLRVEKKGILVRRLSLGGYADLDTEGDTWPTCDLPPIDKRRVEVTASQVSVKFPSKKGEFPALAGRVSARAPIGVVERIGGLPSMDGTVSVSGDMRYAADAKLPEVQDGKIEVTGARVDHYEFAQRIESDFGIQKDVVKSPYTKVWMANGTVVLSDTLVEPLAKDKGIPLKVARVDVKDIDFTALMRELGIARRPHVTWDIQTARALEIKGTLDPLKIDAQVEAQTANFAVYAGPADAPDRSRIIGVPAGHVLTHLAVRPDGVSFLSSHVDMPHGTVDGGSVYLGYKNDLRVDVQHVKVDLVDVTPLGSVPLAGLVEGECHVSGKFGDPHIKADASIQNFALAGIPFGTIHAAHGDFDGDYVELSGVHATKGGSPYEMVTGRLDFRGPAKVKVDGVVRSPSMSMRDLLSIFKLEDDPRFLPIDAKIAATTNLRVVLGGPEDPCGEGRIDVSANADLKDIKLFGESFEDGHADFALRWFDRNAGLAGAEIDVHGATLNKTHRPGAAPQGWILGQAAIHLGGDLRGTVVVESMPLSRIDNLGKGAKLVEGAFSGLFQIGGKVDAFDVQGDLSATPVRIFDTQLGGSRLHFRMTQKPPPPSPPLAGADQRPPQCRSPRSTPFVKEAWLADTSSQGDYILDGTLFDGQLGLERVTISRQKSAKITGKIAANHLDLSRLAHMVLPPREADDAKEAFGGELSGDLTIDRLVVDDLPHASVRFAPRSLVLNRDKQALVLRATKDPLVLDNDTLVVPAYTFDLSAPNQLKGSVLLKGTVARLVRDPELLLGAELSPVDLGFLAGVVPKVTRAQGTLTGGVRITGRAKDPDVDGVLRVRGGEIAIQGVPGAISAIEMDIAASASEARVTRASASFAGGDLGVTGRLSLRGASFGAYDFAVQGRGLRLAPSPGLSLSLDADLRVAQNPSAQGVAASRLPRVSGEVTLGSFDYTRVTNIVPDIGGFRVGATKRTQVDSYDPAQDAVILGPDLTIKARAPLHIHNNLVDVQLGIESSGLQLSGSNQRVGLRGGLYALPGGHLRVFANEFEIQRASVRFDDPTRINPHVDALAVTEYRRYTSTQVAASPAAGAATAGIGGRSGGLWRIGVHATGDAEDLRLEMTSDPALSQEDIFLLLTIGLTRAELDQVQAGSVAASAAFEALGTATGADRAVKQAIPVIDDFRFGSAYSPRTGRSEPQLTLGRRVSDNVRASVTTGLTEDRQLRTLIEWRLSQRLSVQGSYDNLNTTSSSTIGNLGFDVRWRLEFE